MGNSANELVTDDRGNVLLGVSERTMTLCGVKAWDAFPSKDGGTVGAGAKVWLRSDWVDRDGVPRCEVVEHRLVSLPAVGVAPLRALPCGTPVRTLWQRWEAASGKSSWSNLVEIEPVSIPSTVEETAAGKR